MATVLVERQFDAPCDPDALQALEDAAQACLRRHRVHFLRTLISADRTRMVCFYDAPDADAVRQTQRTAGLPVQRVWTATTLTGDEAPAPQGYVMVVVQHALPQGTTREQLAHITSDPTGCGQRLRIQHRRSSLSLDLTRMVCEFRSPDLESVRVLNQGNGLPVEAAWHGIEVTAPP